MKCTIYILTILIFTLTQCTERASFTTKGDFSCPYIVDSLGTTDKKYRTSQMQVPSNDIIYVGTLADTINLNEYDRFNTQDYLGLLDNGDSLTSSNELKIYISDKQLLTIDLEDFSIPPPPAFLENSEDFKLDSIATAKTFNEWKKRPRNNIQSIPVFIYNPGNDTVYLDQQDGRVIMIQEAKDVNGEWKPIEYWRYSSCGNSYGSEGLYPNTLAIVKIIKYDGDFETEIRLKLKNGNSIFYTDSYKGKINRNQFELPSDIKENYLVRRFDDKEYLDRVFLNK